MRHRLGELPGPAGDLCAIRALIVGCAMALAGAWVTPAVAEFSVCNQTLDVVNVAIGQGQASNVTTEGWWTIGSNQCALVIREDLQNRYIYVFATDVFGQALLEGTEPMCIDDKKFLISGLGSCWFRGKREASFLEVDTEAVQRWTLFLTEPPPR